MSRKVKKTIEKKQFIDYNERIKEKRNQKMHFAICLLFIVITVTNIRATDSTINIDDLKKPLLGIGSLIPLEDVQKAATLLTAPKELEEFVKLKGYVLKEEIFSNFVRSLSRDLEVAPYCQTYDKMNKVYDWQVKGKFQEALLSKCATEQITEYETYSIVLLDKSAKIIKHKNNKKSKNSTVVEAYFLYRPGDEDKKFCYLDNLGRLFISSKENIQKESLILSETRQSLRALSSVLNPNSLNVLPFSEIEKYINNTNN